MVLDDLGFCEKSTMEVSYSVSFMLIITHVSQASIREVDP